MSAPRLAEKTALITGGGAGIGAAAATLFCREGAAVLLVDADAQALERTRQAIVQALPGARVLCVAANVADEVAARAAVQQCNAQLGGLDILVNNAAMRNYSAAADATPAEWQAMVGVNLVGMSNYCAAPDCRKGMALYDATKAAQLAYTRSLAFEESSHGVRANAVCPGSTLTDFHVGRAQGSGKSVEQLRTERKDTSLIGRWASPEEIAWPIVWLASSEASFITGTTLMVDGGLHIM
jgi:2-hydroxycyclohexanecarboxyl-CoA dehydrogenase